MNRKFWIGLLVLTFVFGPVGGFWSKPVSANTGSERRVMLCTAWPWSDWEWNKASPPSPSGSDSTYSSVNFTNSGVRVKPQKVQQKAQRSLWSRLQFLLFNFRLFLGGK